MSWCREVLDLKNNCQDDRGRCCSVELSTGVSNIGGISWTFADALELRRVSLQQNIWNIQDMSAQQDHSSAC